MAELSKKIANICSLLSEFFILAIIFFTPLFFAFALKTNNQFELNKIVLFKILTILLFIFTALALIFNKSDIKQFFKNISANRRYFIIPLLFILYLALSSIFSKNFSDAFFGSYFRGQGLEINIFYLLFFFLAIINIKSEKQVFRLLLAIFSSSVLVSLYGLLQSVGIDFISWAEPPLITKRIFSALGQPTFLASYLLLVIPIGFYLFFKSSESLQPYDSSIFTSRHEDGVSRSVPSARDGFRPKFLINFFIIIGVILNISALFLTYSRGAYIGLIAEAGLGLILFFPKYKNFGIWFRDLKTRQNLYKVIIFIFLGLVLIIFSGIITYRKNYYFQVRVDSFLEWRSGSSGTRVNIWKASLRAVKERPLFGYGLDSQQNVFSQYYKKDWGLTEIVNSLPDRAHNLFLDLLLTGGLTGLIFYLALLYLFYKIGKENIKANKGKEISLLILIGAGGYLISLLFVFSITVTNIYFWLYFSILISLNSEFKITNTNYLFEKIETNISQPKDNFLRNFLITVVGVIIAIILALKINFELKTLIADHYFLELKSAANENEYGKTLVLYDYIKELNINSSYYDRIFASIFSDLNFKDAGEAISRPAGAILVKITDEINGDNYFDYLYKGKIYASLAGEENKGYYAISEENYLKAIVSAPEISDTYKRLGDLYFKQGNLEKAIVNFNLALDYLPDTASPIINEWHRRLVNYQKYAIYKSLGDLEMKKSEYQKAENYYLLALDSKSDDILLYRKLADTYYFRRDLDKAILYNKRGMAHNPGDYVWPLSIAYLYEEKGDIVKAKEFCLRAEEIAPESEDVKKLKQALK